MIINCTFNFIQFRYKMGTDGKVTGYTKSIYSNLIHRHEKVYSTKMFFIENQNYVSNKYIFLLVQTSCFFFFPTYFHSISNTIFSINCTMAIKELFKNIYITCNLQKNDPFSLFPRTKKYLQRYQNQVKMQGDLK